MHATALLESFVSPPVSYRPAPFLVFNDDHAGEAGTARITRMLEDYRRVGYGGAFLHPRPGLITEYLSPHWFALIGHAARECRRLGLVAYLYDENSYPSGVAGGHVPARVPEARTQYAQLSAAAGTTAASPARPARRAALPADRAAAPPRPASPPCAAMRACGCPRRGDQAAPHRRRPAGAP